MIPAGHPHYATTDLTGGVDERAPEELDVLEDGEDETDEDSNNCSI